MPFHPNIYALSGYGEMWEKHGEDFSYDLCPRAKIFRRDQAGVEDLDSLKHIMRLNGASQLPGWAGAEQAEPSERTPALGPFGWPRVACLPVTCFYFRIQV